MQTYLSSICCLLSRWLLYTEAHRNRTAIPQQKLMTESVWKFFTRTNFHNYRGTARRSSFTIVFILQDNSAGACLGCAKNAVVAVKLTLPYGFMSVSLMLHANWRHPLKPNTSQQQSVAGNTVVLATKHLNWGGSFVCLISSSTFALTQEE